MVLWIVIDAGTSYQKMKGSFLTNIHILSPSGFSNLNRLTKSTKAHENSESHLQSVVDLYNFGKQRIDELIVTTLKVNNNLHNQKVKKNREVLKRLIDVTCFLAKQELPFRGHNEKTSSLNQENYVETLNLLKLYDPVLAEQFENSTVFKGISNDIQNELISIISEELIETIKQEIEEADFVALMLDEASDIRRRSQLSTVLRYVVKGDSSVTERFLGFTDVSVNRTSNGLLEHVQKAVSEYKLTDKFVAQTYDGASVMTGHLSGLQKKVTDIYPKTLFTHCYAHCLFIKSVFTFVFPNRFIISNVAGRQYQYIVLLKCYQRLSRSLGESNAMKVTLSDFS
ncbi:zinc finger MYM-type protein 1-like [Parasteatoda tepidariorum]|uniref:zinc finger MYM-type protein 1-like n=1 Tax=Parasteatoda tepidariorum TaxID=114398 RepID=UPI0039BC91B1